VRFKEAMDDDFNTPIAISVLFELATEVNSKHDPKLAAQLKALGAVLGLLERDPTDFLQAGQPDAGGGMTPEAIEALIAERAAAKKAKNFARADEIRKQLTESGVVLEDKPGGLTEWRRS
jgi:cysteinyl-tRNA synthetase